MSLTVKNTQRVLFVLNLPAHLTLDPQAYPDLQPTDFAASLPEVDSTGSVIGYRAIERKLPAAITWLPGEEKAGLPNELGQIPEFRRACTTRKLRAFEKSDTLAPPQNTLAVDTAADADAVYAAEVAADERADFAADNERDAPAAPANRGEQV